jgi:hypothetical protein
MRTGQNFGGICVQAAVVDVQTEVNSAIEPENLRGGPDSRESEEEDHSKNGAYDHRASATQVLVLAHKACEDRPENAAEIDNGVVTPRYGWGTVTDVCASGG